jgi:hypothetical protein
MINSSDSPTRIGTHFKMEMDGEGVDRKDAAGRGKIKCEEEEGEAYPSDLPRFSDRIADMVRYRCGLCGRQVAELADHLDAEHRMTIREYAAVTQQLQPGGGGPAFDNPNVQHRYAPMCNVQHSYAAMYYVPHRYAAMYKRSA